MVRSVENTCARVLCYLSKLNVTRNKLFHVNDLHPNYQKNVNGLHFVK